ncbi:amino acid permease [Acidisoma sp. C75]
MTGAPRDHQDQLAWLDSHEGGYKQGLSNRQIQMIAIGGAIGTGLFLGAGARLQLAGPALALVYLVCGILAFLILRALGELVMHRPTSGSFVSYAREFMGERASYVAGWLYFLNWAMTGIVDITAVALYMHYWPAFGPVPQWVFALIALVIVTATNLVGVRWFGELEFWFALLKVAALALFLLFGVVVLGAGLKVGGHHPGLAMISHQGGIFPHGLLAAVVLTQGVIFAYAGVEILGVAAGEAQNAREILPRAINSVIWRIAIFYVGSVVLLVLLLPWTAYKAGQSPFVTFFHAFGIEGTGSVMNVIVITAALSSLNSGLYSTGRVLRSLAIGGSAPPLLARLNGQAVPYCGILVTVVVYAIGVLLNYLVPSQVFELVLNVASVGVLSTWAFILLCQLRLRASIERGENKPVAFRMPLSPYSSWVALACLAAVVVLMAFDWPNGTVTIASLPVIALILWGGWVALKRDGTIMSSTLPSATLTHRVFDRDPPPPPG